MTDRTDRDRAHGSGAPRRLEEVVAADGARDVPGPRPEFVHELETRLLDRAAAGRRRTPGRRPALVALAAAAVTVVVGIGGLLLGSRAGDRAPVAPVLAAASDAVIVTPDGRTRPAVPGEPLVDGTVIRTGPSGTAVIDGITVGPSAEAVIVDGRVVVRDRPPDLARPPVTRPPVTLPTPRVPVTRVPSTTAPPDRPPADRTTTTTPTSGPDRPVGLVGEARYDGTRVVVVWTPYDGADFHAWVILRGPAPHEPTWPPDGATTVVARSRDRDRRAVADTVDTPPDVRYRVVALDAGGRIIADTGPVTPRPFDRDAEPSDGAGAGPGDGTAPSR